MTRGAGSVSLAFLPALGIGFSSRICPCHKRFCSIIDDNGADSASLPGPFRPELYLVTSFFQFPGGLGSNAIFNSQQVGVVVMRGK